MKLKALLTILVVVTLVFSCSNSVEYSEEFKNDVGLLPVLSYNTNVIR